MVAASLVALVGCYLQEEPIGCCPGDIVLTKRAHYNLHVN